MTIEHCPVTISGPSTASVQMLLEMNPLSSQLIGWGLMVIAMMLPKIITPIQFIYAQSLKRYRFRLALLFVLGYVSVWMIAGVFMIGAIMWLSLLVPLSNTPALVVLAVALVWQFSPIKQRFLNYGHQHRVLPAFGWEAHKASFSFGITHGTWCVGSGWAMMLFPMLLQEWHNVAMLFVTFLMISEHMEHPRPPRWHFDLRLKLLRIIIAQTKIRLMKRA